MTAKSHPEVAACGGEDASARTRITDKALRELADRIEAGQLPEIIPTRQERSLRTALAMLQAGRSLLMDRSLEELSVEMVCQAAGTTVGAFYGRFENKHAFFVSMQRMQVIQAEKRLEQFVQRLSCEQPGFDALCEEMVRMTVERYRENVGVLRAALQHTQQGMWQMFKASGDHYRKALITYMAPHLRHLPEAARELRMLFAYQMLSGTLVHAVLNNPGPLALGDDALIGELTRMVRAYLGAP